MNIYTPIRLKNCTIENFRIICTIIQKKIIFEIVRAIFQKHYTYLIMTINYY